MTGVGVLEVPRHAAEQQCIGDAIGDRVEEGASGRRRSGGLGDRPVEYVRHSGEDQQEEPEAQGTVGDGDGGADGHHEAEQGEVIRADAALTQVGADRAELLLHARTEALVEHQQLRLDIEGTRGRANSSKRYQRPSPTCDMPIERHLRQH